MDESQRGAVRPTAITPPFLNRSRLLRKSLTSTPDTLYGSGDGKLSARFSRWYIRPMSSPSRNHGWTASALLAVLTIAVFFVLQNYGPESAVRRFHDALLRRDGREL